MFIFPAKKSIEYIKIFYGIILGFSIFFLAATFSRLNIDVHHQGIMFSAAMRVFNGEPLYIGNLFYYGPLVPILNAFGIYLFGKYLLVLQLMASACYGLIAILLWRIWARFLPEILSGFIVLISFLLSPFLYWEFHPWSSVYSLLFSLLSLFYIIKWIETNKYRQLILAGFFVGLTFWSRQTVGLFLFIFLFFPLILIKYSLNKKNFITSKFLFYILGFFVPIIFGIILLYLNNSLQAWFKSCFSSRL